MYTVGGKNLDEQQVLCKMSIEVLRSRGATVIDRCGTLSTAAAREALLSGQIDLQWEYTGIGWVVDLHQPAWIPDAQLQYQAVRDADAANGLTWLQPSVFNNTYGLAARASTLQNLHVHTISDLARLVNSGSNQVTICAEPKFAVRQDTLAGMLQVYGFARTPPIVTTTNINGSFLSTSNGRSCSFGEVFTTDGRLGVLGLEPLVDDRKFFPYYNASAVFRTATLEREPTVRVLFEEIARRLTDDVMRKLNTQISSGVDPERVATTWLHEQSLV